MSLQDKKVILDNVCKLVPSLKHAKHVQDWVGLRPYREPVRLQLQHHKVKRLLSTFTHLIIVHSCLAESPWSCKACAAHLPVATA